MIEFLILYILKIKSSNIYEIKKLIDEKFVPYLQVSSGAIIPALKRLEKAGVVVSEKQISQGGLRKSFYSITENGEKLFNDILLEPLASSPQLLRRELEILLMLQNDEIFSEEQLSALKIKIIDGIDILIKLLKKAIAKKKMNVEYLELELAFWENQLNNMR